MAFNHDELVLEINKLRQFARKLCRNKDEAEDLLQATVLRALEKRHLYEQGTDLFAWTSKMMFNLFATQYRRRVKFETQYDCDDIIQSQSVEASQEKKAELLSQASMLALVSYEEGFAFPMLEAFRAHVPVLASSIPTLKEIGEDAALFADPNDPEALAASMTRLADEKDLCERLVANGRKNLERYSWDAVVEQIVNILSG